MPESRWCAGGKKEGRKKENAADPLSVKERERARQLMADAAPLAFQLDAASAPAPEVQFLPQRRHQGKAATRAAVSAARPAAAAAPAPPSTGTAAAPALPERGEDEAAMQPLPSPAVKATSRGKGGKRSVEPAPAAAPPEAEGNAAAEAELQQALPQARECVQAWKAALAACREQGHPLARPLRSLDKDVMPQAHRRCAFLQAASRR